MTWFFILGTRPEIIKMSPIILRAIENDIEIKLIHSGQHYSYEMDQIFFDELNLPRPNYALDIGSGTQGYQTARIIEGVEKILLIDNPEMVMVLGDTNTTLGGALAAAKIQSTKLVHIEAGCRSYNRKMPEEVNRILVDHISDILFAATENDKKNLEREGLSNNVFVVGSTGIEAGLRNIKIARKKSKILKKLSLKEKKYIVVTIHRAETTDNNKKLKGIVSAINNISEKINVIFPIHPRTQKAMHSYNLTLSPKVRMIKPQGYLDFLLLLDHSKCVLTDSGGIQEEASALGISCFTLREETEWVDTVKCGINKLIGWREKKIIEEISNFLENPFVENKMRLVTYPPIIDPSKRIIETLFAHAAR